MQRPFLTLAGNKRETFGLRPLALGFLLALFFIAQLPQPRRYFPHELPRPLFHAWQRVIRLANPDRYRRAAFALPGRGFGGFDAGSACECFVKGGGHGTGPSASRRDFSNAAN